MGSAINSNNTKNLTKSVAKGASLQVLGGVVQTVCRLGASTILARHLTPTDFGLFGMALLTRELIEYLGNIGVGTGVIAKKELKEIDLVTSFWLITTTRLFLFLIAFIFAPIAALFFNEPRVTNILRVTSLTFLFSIPGLIPQLLLQKRMAFKYIVSVRMFAILIESSTAVILVTTTSMGYWSLVFPMLIASIFIHTSFFYKERWVPSFNFNRESFQYFFKFGINGLGTSITQYLSENIDYWMVGRLFGTRTLGLYEFAYRLPHIIQVRFALPIISVVFPAMSQVQHSNRQLFSGYIKTTRYLSFGVLPLLSGLATVAPIAVLILWGEGWLSIIIPLQILCVSATISSISKVTTPVFQCKNRPDLPFKLGIASVLFGSVSIYTFGNIYSLNGVALGILISTLPGVYGIYLVLKLTKSKANVILQALLAPLWSSTSSTVVAYTVIELLTRVNINPIIILPSAIIGGGVGYLMCLTLFFPSDLKEVTQTISLLHQKHNAASK